VQNNLPIPAEFLGETKKIKHYTQSITQNVHHFYLYGELEDDIEKYADLINLLKTSSELDTIIIYINSEGGSLRMAIQITNSMIASNANVITSLDGNAFSAASMIFLAGHEYIINDNCSFMIHTYSGGLVGKGHEIGSQYEHIQEYTKKIFEKFYEKVLTEQELKDVINGQDIWMDSEQLLERLDAQAKKAEEFQKELDKAENNAVEYSKSKKKTKKKAKKKTEKK
jgi:ATP-dependent Clp protease, protease subunit